MTIQWYGLAQVLGLVKNISHEYNDGGTYWTVAGNTDDVFLTLQLSLIAVMFFVGFLVHFMYRVKQTPQKGETVVLGCTVVLLIYAVLLAVGIGPYIQFYPQSAGFLDFSALEHIIDGIYTAILALMVFLGGKVDKGLSKRKIDTM